MKEIFCDCKKPTIKIIEWTPSTWGLEKGQSYKECLKCVRIIEDTLIG